MSKSLRTFTPLRRPLTHPHPITRYRHLTRYRHSLTSQSGGVYIQPIRLSKGSPGQRIRRSALESLFFVSVTSAVLWYFDLLEDEEEGGKEGKAATPAKSELQFHTGEELDQAVKETEEDEDEVQIPDVMPEDAFFIPLGLTRQKPQEYYKASDPEWRSFVDFKKDRDREKSVKKELPVLVGNHFSGMKQMQKGLGIPMKITRTWIDVVVPTGPPLEYERSGLEIADDYIAWTTRPISALQRDRLQAAIFPLPVAKAFWASFSTTCSLQAARVKQFLNLDSKSEGSDAALSTGMTNLDQIQESTTKQESQNPARMNKMSDPKSSEGSSAKDSSKPPSPESSKILSSLPSIPKIGDGGPAVMEFKRSLAKNWKPPQDFGTRGSLMVTGLVEMEGPHGTCVIDIAASYHPQEARYTHIACGIRNFRPRRQRPQGGP